MKEFIKYIYLITFGIIFYVVERYLNLSIAIVFGIGLIIKNQLDIEEKLNDLDEKEDKERELWRAILPTRKRF